MFSRKKEMKTMLQISRMCNESKNTSVNHSYFFLFYQWHEYNEASSYPSIHFEIRRVSNTITLLAEYKIKITISIQWFLLTTPCHDLHDRFYSSNHNWQTILWAGADWYKYSTHAFWCLLYSAPISQACQGILLPLIKQALMC